MQCDRCTGLLVEEHCYDLFDNEISMTALRCISCGNLVDDVILKNRLAQRTRRTVVAEAWERAASAA